MSTPQVTIVSNQSKFREANESLSRSASEYELAGLLPFICECPTTGCTELVRLSREEYEAVRASGRRFLIAHGHEEAAGSASRVVELHERYAVTEQIGEAAGIAEAQNPRADAPTKE
jgi:hypothetical protein